ncbi:MAG: nucleotidyl transferase AbiEii/AbiGii toxin family protein [Candidatus Levybacteria bacterium]|nr:nucleotidyl transferase AbiEii/AbiGii toxin family protein [Candidatus Levybacteria bacterium]
MDITSARELSQKLQISVDYIAREEYEILILKEVFESEFGVGFVFKGGTALRLAYNSPRFSQDIDFTQIQEFDKEKFMTFLRGLANKYPAIKSIETNEKFYTIFGLAKIKEDYLKRAFSIKIEISKRERKWVKGKDYTDKLIRSETTPLTAIAQVASLEQILAEKKDAMKNRKVARDLFDYWYIHLLLKQEIKVDFQGYDKKRAKSELHRLLPRNFWRVIETWLI